jgi:replicative DNA helicase
MEMSGQQYGIRALSRESGIASSKLRTGKLFDKDWAALSGGIGRLHGVPVYINTDARRPSEIQQACRDMMHSIGLDLCVIDYLQLAEADGKHGNREQEVASVSRAVKRLTQTVPVLALSQLSRTGNRVPQLSDLRESGSLEQDADNVMFLYEPDEVPNFQDYRAVMVKIAKQRQGETGTVKLAFRPSSMTYTEVEERRRAPGEE